MSEMSGHETSSSGVSPLINKISQEYIENKEMDEYLGGVISA